MVSESARVNSEPADSQDPLLSTTRRWGPIRTRAVEQVQAGESPEAVIKALDSAAVVMGAQAPGVLSAAVGERPRWRPSSPGWQD